MKADPRVVEYDRRRRADLRRINHVYRYTVAPDLDIAVEDSANVVLIAGGKTITLTNVDHLIAQLVVCKQLAAVIDEEGSK